MHTLTHTITNTHKHTVDAWAGRHLSEIGYVLFAQPERKWILHIFYLSAMWLAMALPSLHDSDLPPLGPTRVFIMSFQRTCSSARQKPRQRVYQRAAATLKFPTPWLLLLPHLLPFLSPFPLPFLLSFSPVPTSTREFFTHWYNDCSCRGECCCCPSHKCCCCTPYCCCCCCCCSHWFTLSFGTHTHTHTQTRTRNWSTLRHLHSFIKICALLAFIKWISMCLHFASLPPFPIPSTTPRS